MNFGIDMNFEMTENSDSNIFTRINRTYCSHDLIEQNFFERDKENRCSLRNKPFLNSQKADWGFFNHEKIASNVPRLILENCDIEDINAIRSSKISNSFDMFALGLNGVGVIHLTNVSFESSYFPKGIIRFICLEPENCFLFLRHVFFNKYDNYNFSVSLSSLFVLEGFAGHVFG